MSSQFPPSTPVLNYSFPPDADLPREYQKLITEYQIMLAAKERLQQLHTVQTDKYLLERAEGRHKMLALERQLAQLVGQNQSLGKELQKEKMAHLRTQTRLKGVLEDRARSPLTSTIIRPSLSAFSFPSPIMAPARSIRLHNVPPNLDFPLVAKQGEEEEKEMAMIYEESSPSSSADALGLHLTTTSSEDATVWTPAQCSDEFLLVRLLPEPQKIALALQSGPGPSKRGRIRGRGGHGGGTGCTDHSTDPQYSHFVANVLSVKADFSARRNHTYKIHYYKKAFSEPAGVWTFSRYTNETTYEIDCDSVVERLPKPIFGRRGGKCTFDFCFDAYKLG